MCLQLPAPKSRGGSQRYGRRFRAQLFNVRVAVSSLKLWVREPQDGRDAQGRYPRLRKDSAATQGLLTSESLSCLLRSQPSHLTTGSEGRHLAVIKRKSLFFSAAIVKKDVTHQQAAAPRTLCKRCPPLPPTGRFRGGGAAWLRADRPSRARPPRVTVTFEQLTEEGRMLPLKRRNDA